MCPPLKILNNIITYASFQAIISFFIFLTLNYFIVELIIKIRNETIRKPLPTKVVKHVFFVN